jgi:cytochrome c-type biogenesis protein
MPISAVILAFVYNITDIVYGSSLLFVYAVGHCALIILAGIFTGFVESYAKSKGVSNFSALTKKISGILIFLGGLYILYINV